MNILGNDGKNEEAHFIRQRRYLIITSLFVLFYKIGNLELKTVNFLGNQADINNPIIITFCLGILLIYFLWRYYTACREVAGINAFNLFRINWIEKECNGYVEKKYKVSANQFHIIRRIKNEPVYNIYSDSDDPVSQGKEVRVTSYYYIKRALSIPYAILHSTSFSEYILPYIIAVVAILEFTGFKIVENVMLFTKNFIDQGITSMANIEVSQPTQITKAPVSELVPTSANSECIFDLFNLCFKEPNSNLSNVSVFGFGEFIAAIALLVIIYTFSDIRYKFRLRVAAIPLFRITYVCIAVIGFGTLLVDVWSASLWPVPNIPISKFVVQGTLGFLFLIITLVWIFYAFIRPPVFSKWNAKRYANELMYAILEGTDKELPVIAHELGRSAKNIVEISRRSPSRTQTEEENEKAKPSIKPTAGDCAYEILLMIGTRRFCRYIISSAPVTAIEFFARFSENLHKSLPVGQFVVNVSTEAIINEDSLLYHEDHGYYSGWLGYVRPFSKAIYGDYKLINMLSNMHASPLDVHHKTMHDFSDRQFEVYTRAVLITLEAYINDHKSGETRSFTLSSAFEFIAHSAYGVYKLDGNTEYYPTEAYSKLNTAVSFVNQSIRLLNKYSIPETRVKTWSQFDIYDQIAELMFEIIYAASNVKSPRDTCWSIHYNTVWSRFFSPIEKGKAQKIIYFRLRRLLYDEINRLNELPNYKSARILGICLNVLGPVLPEKPFRDEDTGFHKVLISWLEKNYLQLRKRHPDVANACLVGSITYDEEKKRLIKTYIKGLNLEEPTEFLELEKK